MVQVRAMAQLVTASMASGECVLWKNTRSGLQEIDSGALQSEAIKEVEKATVISNSPYIEEKDMQDKHFKLCSEAVQHFRDTLRQGGKRL